MITKLDKKNFWDQANFRMPRSYRFALKALAEATGLNIEEIGAEAVGLFLGRPPLEPCLTTPRGWILFGAPLRTYGDWKGGQHAPRGFARTKLLELLNQPTK